MADQRGERVGRRAWQAIIGEDAALRLRQVEAVWKTGSSQKYETCWRHWRAAIRDREGTSVVP